MEFDLYLSLCEVRHDQRVCAAAFGHEECANWG